MKKKIILICAAISMAVVSCTVVFTVINKSKTTTIAFYHIPEDYQTSIIQNLNIPNAKYINIDEKTYISENLNNKANIVISYNDARIQELKSKSLEISKNLQQKFPNSVKNSQFYTNNQQKMTVFPILLDNFEFGVLKIAQTRYGAKLPETVYEIDDFCSQIKPAFPLPMIIAGAEDINVNSFFSLLVQSYGGLEGYKNVSDQLSATTDFSQIFDYKIGGDAPDYVTIRTVLNDILFWQDRGYINSKWMENTQKHTEKFIENGISAVCLMNMSEHRNKPKPNANHYIPEAFPLQTAQTPVSIQPAIVAVTLKKSLNSKEVFEQLSSITVQEALSEQTKLAPAILQGETYDSLTTTARFTAASYSSGPVPDLGTLSFSTKENQYKLAEEIRKYCGK